MPRLSFCSAGSQLHVVCDCLAVVGEKEKANNAVNVRTRDNKVHGEISVSSAIEKLKKFKSSRVPNAEEEF